MLRENPLNRVVHLAIGIDSAPAGNRYPIRILVRTKGACGRRRQPLQRNGLVEIVRDALDGSIRQRFGVQARGRLLHIGPVRRAIVGGLRFRATVLLGHAGGARRIRT